MPDATPSPSLLSALARILSPVARLMLARGVTLPLAVELLKRVYIDVARRDFRLEGKSATDSRISLLTGVHRKDVRRLRELPAAPSELPAKVSFGAQAVARWTTVADFLESSGQPRALPRQARAGEASFESLVGGISRDIRPRSLLDEWLRLGIVRREGQGPVLQFFGDAGRSYTVLGTTNLTSWTTMSVRVPPGNTSVPATQHYFNPASEILELEVVLPAAAPKAMFFRVQVD